MKSMRIFQVFVSNSIPYQDSKFEKWHLKYKIKPKLKML